MEERMSQIVLQNLKLNLTMSKMARNIKRLQWRDHLESPGLIFPTPFPVLTYNIIFICLESMYILSSTPFQFFLFSSLSLNLFFNFYFYSTIRQWGHYFSLSMGGILVSSLASN